MKSHRMRQLFWFQMHKMIRRERQKNGFNFNSASSSMVVMHEHWILLNKSGSITSAGGLTRRQSSCTYDHQAKRNNDEWLRKLKNTHRKKSNLIIFDVNSWFKINAPGINFPYTARRYILFSVLLQSWLG